ncbi:MAG: hypothetical protein WBQ34_08765, partial [Candidatus Acidiferrales bacterium]
MIPAPSPRFIIIAALLLLIGGCSSNHVESVSISPRTSFVGSGQTTQFTATVTGGNSRVTWGVNGVAGGTATTGTIDANGDYSAPSVTQNATATVTAIVGGESASAAVSIVAPGAVTTTNEPQVA